MEVTTVALSAGDTLNIGEIRTEWHWIKPAIEEILEANPHLTYIPEDVYAEVKSGHAVLWVADKAFAVTTSETDQYSGEKTLLVWVCWSKPNGTSVLFRHLEELTRVAADSGYAWIETRTQNERLGEALGHWDWELDHIVYRRSCHVFKT